jgi:hypothetical protein
MKYKEILIYAGANRTGTCSVRAILSNSRKRLLDQNILYPSFSSLSKYFYNGKPSWDATPIVDAVSAVKLSGSVLETEEVQALDDEICQNADVCDRVIIMSERFYDFACVPRFREWVKHLYQFTDQVTIYCVVRRYPEYCESVFRHWLRCSYSYFPEIIECERLSDALELFARKNNMCGFSRRARGFEEIVGESSVRLESFSPDGGTEENIVSRLLSNIDISVFKYEHLRANRTQPTYLLEYFFEILKRLIRRYSDDYRRYYDKIVRLSLDANLDPVLPLSSDRRSILSRSKAQHLLHCGIENDKDYIRSKYGRYTFFSDRLDMYSDNESERFVLSSVLLEQMFRFADLDIF